MSTKQFLQLCIVNDDVYSLDKMECRAQGNAYSVFCDVIHVCFSQMLLRNRRFSFYWQPQSCSLATCAAQ